MYLSVVIPQYNESQNIRSGAITSVAEYLGKQNFEWELIIVDDGSTDDSYSVTQNIIQKNPKIKQIRIPHGGKPAAIYEGIKLVKSDYILLTDMDQSTPISELEKLIKYTNQFPIIIGSRGGTRKDAPLLRKLSGFIFGTYRRILILRSIKDTQCGFKLFNVKVLKKYFPRISSLGKKNVKGWSVSAFDVELLFMLSKAGYRIKEVPVKWNDLDKSETKDRKFINESLDMAKQIWMIQFNNLRGKYKEAP